MLLDMLREGQLHLSGIARLAPHLTRENRDDLLARAVHKSHRQIVEIVADLAPKAGALATIRKLPTPRGAATPASAPQWTRRAPAQSSLTSQSGFSAPPALIPQPGSFSQGGPNPPSPEESPPSRSTGSQEDSELCARRVPSGRRATIEPISSTRFRVRFDAGVELRDKLERLQALMRSSVPDGDLAKIIDLAVTEKLERLEAKRFAKTKKARKTLAQTDTRPKSRYIPAAVRRVVYERDGGRCTYRDEYGGRCAKRHDLEFHHHGTPFGRGGPHSPDVVRLMCTTHNALMAEKDYGKEVMARFRRSTARVARPVALPSTGSVPRRPPNPPG